MIPHQPPPYRPACFVPDPSLTPPNLGVFRLYDTVAILQYHPHIGARFGPAETLQYFPNISIFCMLLQDFDANIKKMRRKNIFWPALGVPSTQTLVKIYNTQGDITTNSLIKKYYILNVIWHLPPTHPEIVAQWHLNFLSLSCKLSKKRNAVFFSKFDKSFSIKCITPFLAWRLKSFFLQKCIFTFCSFGIKIVLEVCKMKRNKSIQKILTKPGLSKI